MTLIEKHMKELVETREALVDAILGGRTADYAEYKRMSGEIRGLDRGIQAFRDLANALENDDDE